MALVSCNLFFSKALFTSDHTYSVSFVFHLLIVNSTGLKKKEKKKDYENKPKYYLQDQPGRKSWGKKKKKFIMRRAEEGIF